MTAMKVTVRQMTTGRGYRVVRRSQVHREPTLWQRLLSLFSPRPEVILARQQRLQAIEAEQGRFYSNTAGQVICLPERQGRN